MSRERKKLGKQMKERVRSIPVSGSMCGSMITLSDFPNNLDWSQAHEIRFDLMVKSQG